MASKFKVAFQSNAGVVKGTVTIAEDGATVADAESFLASAKVTAVKQKQPKAEASA